MLFNSLEHFEKSLYNVTKHIDSTGEFSEILSFHIQKGNLYGVFEKFAPSIAKKIPYKTDFENPRQGNAFVDLVGDHAYKYVDDIVTLLEELCAYFAIMAAIHEAESVGIIPKDTHLKFMEIESLFIEEGSDKIGYISKRLDEERDLKKVLKGAKEMFNLFYKFAELKTFMSHGDFKIDNILINKNGDICLIDFGISLIDFYFKDGGNICNSSEKTAKDMAYVDPLIFAITYNMCGGAQEGFENCVDSTNGFFSDPEWDDTSDWDYFSILQEFPNYRSFLDNTYDLAYNYFYDYHKEEVFNFDKHFPEYLKLKK